MLVEVSKGLGIHFDFITTYRNTVMKKKIYGGIVSVCKVEYCGHKCEPPRALCTVTGLSERSGAGVW